jgi:hypothetical protein
MGLSASAKRSFTNGSVMASFPNGSAVGISLWMDVLIYGSTVDLYVGPFASAIRSWVGCYITISVQGFCTAARVSLHHDPTDESAMRSCIPYLYLSSCRMFNGTSEIVYEAMYNDMSHN